MLKIRHSKDIITKEEYNNFLSKLEAEKLRLFHQKESYIKEFMSNYFDTEISVNCNCIIMGIRREITLQYKKDNYGIFCQILFDKNYNLISYKISSDNESINNEDVIDYFNPFLQDKLNLKIFFRSIYEQCRALSNSSDEFVKCRSFNIDFFIDNKNKIEKIEKIFVPKLFLNPITNEEEFFNFLNDWEQDNNDNLKQGFITYHWDEDYNLLFNKSVYTFDVVGNSFYKDQIKLTKEEFINSLNEEVLYINGKTLSHFFDLHEILDKVYRSYSVDFVFEKIKPLLKQININKF